METVSKFEQFGDPEAPENEYKPLQADLGEKQ
jgi:hypothetical protein